MRVYHGSYLIVDNPHISFSRAALDFGKGFYVTRIKEQAINWTNKFKRRGKKGYLNIYELDIEKVKEKYKVKEFLSYDLEWLDFILECRAESNIYLKYDMVVGGIADDRVYNTIELYQLVSEGAGDLHCKGVKYLTDELMLEYGIINHKSYPKDLIH